MQNYIPPLQINIQEQSNNSCHSASSKYFKEHVLISERSGHDPEQVSYKIVGPIDKNDYIIKTSFWDELGNLANGLEDSPEGSALKQSIIERKSRIQQI